jgi:CBS domain-containing protein
MPDSIVKAAAIEITPLSVNDTVESAVRRLVEQGLPGLPAVDAEGRFAGIFGEREFMAALFPGYVAELGSARLVSTTIDAAIDRRSGCRSEPIEGYLTTDQVLVEDDFSDTLLAELFLHHRVILIPIATKGRVHAIVTRSDFFRALVGRFMDKHRPLDERQSSDGDTPAQPGPG